ncbi:hypothetical protein H696_02115 [Fonticula alba]|uniref:DUF1279 domain-containing protein n=1 Tax=Fonticula alba TaxID=691883 RepID=A0A058ZA36_FONAL|nr:hypothetical protein H696_02115 [Fonticula alba]KCV71164.1 hypothetical protein H696_02115 [Fonticula alba]|eukprot:XP_009494287.1 hypothetical protein H696_02115 [Fonticula alba]
MLSLRSGLAPATRHLMLAQRSAGLLAPRCLMSTQTSAGQQTPPPPNGDAPKPEEETKKLSLAEKMKHMTKTYGPVAIGVHSTVYMVTISSMYVALKSGVDVTSLMSKVGLDRLIDLSTLDPNSGTLLMAFILAKCTSPIRTPLTLALTPPAARMVDRTLIRMGYPPRFTGKKPAPPTSPSSDGNKGDSNPSA